MAEINQRLSQFVQVPRELYALVRESYRSLVLENFFESLASACSEVGRLGAISSVPSGDYTVLSTDRLLLLDATDGDIAVTHITAVGQGGRDYIFKRIDDTANTVTVTTAETIDGDSSFSLYPYEVIRTESDNVEWWII